MIVYYVVFRDLTSIELPERKGEVIKAAWLGGRKSPFEYEGNGYHTSDILRVIKKQKRDEEPAALPPPATMLPEEKRKHNLEMIAKMRQDFLKKLKERKGE